MTNGDEIKVHHGDKVITLEEQLERMNKNIRRLQISQIIIAVLVGLSIFLTDEHMVQLVDGFIGLFIGD